MTTLGDKYQEMAEREERIGEKLLEAGAISRAWNHYKKAERLRQKAAKRE